jgi:hypothetical protein
VAEKRLWVPDKGWVRESDLTLTDLEVAQRFAAMRQKATEKEAPDDLPDVFGHRLGTDPEE